MKITTTLTANLIATAALLLGWQTQLRAAETTDAMNAMTGGNPMEDKWQFKTAPYLWAAGIDGNVTIKGQTTDLDIGFDEIWDNLSGAFMNYMEVRKGKLGFYVSPLYMQLESDSSIRTGGKINFQQDLWIVEAGAIYNIAKLGESKPIEVDAIAGVRYWNNQIDLDFSGPIIGNAGVSTSEDVVDPIIGLRANQHFTERFSWSLSGDVGGGNITAKSSDFDWQAMGLLGYDISHRFSVWGGYRAIGIKTENHSSSGDEGMDLTLHGPIFGLEIRF